MHPSAIIYESEHVTIFTRMENQTPVVVKALMGPEPGRQQIHRLENEYEITRRLRIPGIRRAYRKEKFEGRHALVLAYIPGLPLSQAFADGSLTLPLFLHLAAQAAEILARLHNEGILHRDLSGNNFIFSPQTQRITLIDFELACKLGAPDTEPQAMGSLPYLSPEQTGRVNRQPDARSDLYSLGMVLYELLTGNPPFAASDAAAWVHAHLAIAPPLAHEGPGNRLADAAIPPPISRMIDVLIRKDPDQRYPSARALLQDIQALIRQWSQHGKFIALPFDQGAYDFSLRQVSRLYGRAEELDRMRRAWDKAKTGELKVTALVGGEGVGKSALANQARAWVQQEGGYFVEGGFDPLNASPYHGLIPVLTDFVNQALAESPDQLEFWKNLIREAAGEYAKLVTDVAPNLRLIIGDPPELPETGVDLQNKFAIALREIIRALSGDRHPLAIFLDGCESMDPASLHMLEVLVSDVQNPFTWIILSLRADPDTELSESFRQLTRQAISLDLIPLHPPSREAVGEWLHEIIGQQLPETAAAADILYQKTHGNPFSLQGIFSRLLTDGLLIRAEQVRAWQWDLNAVQRLSVSENVADLLAEKVQGLPAPLREALALAATFGYEFPPAGMELLSADMGRHNTPSFSQALEEGLILDISSVKTLHLDEGRRQTLKFAHEGIRKVCYEILDIPQRQQAHLCLGRLFARQLPKEVQEDILFEHTHHWNQAAILVEAREERKYAAALNLSAGKRALASSAYAAALSYFEQGCRFLADYSWEQFYSLNLDLHTLGAEAAFLAGAYETAANLSQRTEQQAFNLVDRVRVWNLQLQALAAESRWEEALQLGLSFLARLGYPLPARPRRYHFLLARIKAVAARKMGKHIPGRGEEQPRAQAALQVLERLMPVAAVAPSDQALLSVYLGAYLFFSEEASLYAPRVLIEYGIAVAFAEKRLTKGYALGAQGMAYFQANPAPERKASVFLAFYSHLWPLRHRMHEAVSPLREAFEAGVRYSDWAAAGEALEQHYLFRLFIGQDLGPMVGELTEAIEMAARPGLTGVAASLGHIHNLITQARDGYSSAVTPAQSEKPDTSDASLSRLGLFCRLQAAYLFEDTEAVIHLLALMDLSPKRLVLQGLSVWIEFQTCLACANAYPHQPGDWQRKVEIRIKKVLKALKALAAHCPPNYQLAAYLLEAEWLRVQGISESARLRYEQAIEWAREQEFPLMEALASELLGKYYREQNQGFLAEVYLTRALRLYERLGAGGKASFLVGRYPRFLGRNLRARAELPGSGSSGKWSGIDLESIIQASQALAGEVVLSSLLEKLLRIVMQNAGAEKAVMIELQDHDLAIVGSAEASGEVQIAARGPRLLNQSDTVPQSLIHYCLRTQTPLVIDDYKRHPEFSKDKYLARGKPLSALCFPITHKGSIAGLLYLENNLTEGAFTEERVEIIRVLSAQIAISLENARFYEHLDEKVRARTFELNRKNEELANTLNQLQSTQSQLVQSEKMASLGQLTAGIAHEINNPINFISGNISPLTRNLDELRHYYQKASALSQQTDLPAALADLEAFRQAIDADYLFEEIDVMLAGIRDGAQRTQQIVAGLQNFSRSDESRFRSFDVNEGIESTLTLLNNKLKDRIRVHKSYSQLPPIEALPGKLNQAFMNILSNAIQAIEGSGEIYIRTGLEGEEVRIEVRDSGPGVPEALQTRIFEPFFTTKEVGQGTGLGLSITYGILEQHKGRIMVNNYFQGGAVFTIFIPIAQP